MAERRFMKISNWLLKDFLAIHRSKESYKTAIQISLIKGNIRSNSMESILRVIPMLSRCSASRPDWSCNLATQKHRRQFERGMDLFLIMIFEVHRALSDTNFLLLLLPIHSSGLWKLTEVSPR